MRRLGLMCIVALSVAPRPAAAEQYAVTGMVMRVDQAHATFVVSHDSIAGLMGPMMMPFTVNDPHELEGVTPGVAVAFTLVVSKESSYATAVHLRPYQSVEQDPTTTRRLALLKRLSSPVARLAETVPVGSLVPDFALIDQRRRPVSLGGLRGRIVAVNFVYTRCALPQFCFRTASSFAAVAKRFGTRLGRDLVLLTVTFDPERDQPDVLARYAQQWKADAATWHFLTGAVPDVRRVTNLFGLDFFPDEGLLDHAVRTAVIDRDGHLVANIEGNQYSTEQLGNLIQTVMEQ